MSHSLFDSGEAVTVSAYLTEQRFDLARIDKAATLATGPMVLKAGKAGFAVIFRFGTVVFFNAGQAEEEAFFNAHPDVFELPFIKLEHEHAQIILNGQSQKVEHNIIRLQSCTIEHLQIIATALSKSIYLAHYEVQIARIFNLIEPMASHLKRTGHAGQRARALLRQIGEVLLIESRMVGRVEIEDKPDLIWDRPDLDQLYMLMSHEYELRDRMTNLRQKLNLIHLTADTLLNYLQNRSTHHVEWYIVILILIEIFLSLGEKFLVF